MKTVIFPRKIFVKMMRSQLKKELQKNHAKQYNEMTEEEQNYTENTLLENFKNMGVYIDGKTVKVQEGIEYDPEEKNKIYQLIIEILS